MNFQQFIIVGNASTDAQLRTSKKGDVTFLAFAMGVSSGKDTTSFFPVVVFGELGKALAAHISKGRQLLVEGRIEKNDGRFNVVADRVVLGVKPTQVKPKESKEKK